MYAQSHRNSNRLDVRTRGRARLAAALVLAFVVFAPPGPAHASGSGCGSGFGSRFGGFSLLGDWFTRCRSSGLDSVFGPASAGGSSWPGLPPPPSPGLLPTDLQVELAASEHTVLLGASLDYRVTLTNQGPRDARDAGFDLSAPLGFRLWHASFAGARCSRETVGLPPTFEMVDQYQCRGIDLVVGESRTFTIPARVGGCSHRAAIATATAEPANAGRLNNEDRSSVHVRLSVDRSVAGLNSDFTPAYCDHTPPRTETAPDPSDDADADGLPNVYESTHRLDPLDPADALADADGDGYSSLHEYVTGTDPLDAASSPRTEADAVLRAAPDLDGDGTGDHVLARVDPATGEIWLTVLGGADARPLARHIIGAEHLPWLIAVSSGRDGDSPMIAATAIDPALGEVRVSFLDALTGARTAEVWPGAGTPWGIEPLEGGTDVAVLQVEEADGSVKVSIIDSTTGAIVSSIAFGNAVAPRALRVLPDLDGNGFADVAVLGRRYRDYKPVAILSDAARRDPRPAIGLELAPGSMDASAPGGSHSAVIALLEDDRNSGRMRVEIADAGTTARVHLVRRPILRGPAVPSDAGSDGWAAVAIWSKAGLTGSDLGGIVGIDRGRHIARPR